VRRAGPGSPSPLVGSMHSVVPDATIALKTAPYSVLQRGMTGVDLARDLRIDERKASRLVDPRAASSLASLEDALAVLG
jgi:hypothetical protein